MLFFFTEFTACYYCSFAYAYPYVKMVENHMHTHTRLCHLLSEQTGLRVYPHCPKMATCRIKAVPHWVSSRKKLKSLTASWVKVLTKIFFSV